MRLFDTARGEIVPFEPGEEVSYDYYTSPGEYTQRCKCGAENCRGYL